MKSNSTNLIHQATKAALVTTVALALLLPADLAGAESVTATSNTSMSASVSGPANTDAEAPDPAKVKFTKEQAIAKLKELFPTFKDATVSHVELGSTDSYPPPANQMVWTIQWQYQIGSTGFGFSSQVDAITGDLIHTNIHFPLQDNQAYYPPKVTEAQALEKAQAFIAKAASSIKSADLKLQEDSIYNYNNSALFGPVQYNFTFNLLKNGIHSLLDNVMVTVDGNGNVISFMKSSEGLVYPSAVPKITQAQAEKSIKDSFDVGLYYIPVYKNGAENRWILGWRPVEQALYSIDAHTGKKQNDEGTVTSSAPVTYTDVPLGKEVFQPRSASTELTGEQAAKLVEKIGYVPAGRKLTSKILSDDYMNRDKKTWRLMWGDNQHSYGGGPSSQSYAEVDALTGEIFQFQGEQYMMQEKGKPQTAPAGAKKLTPAEAKQKAIGFVNMLYPKASSTLKQIEYGGDWNVISDGSGYRYQFIRYYKGIPVSDSTISVNLDVYGRLQNYIGSRLSVDAITQEPAAKITKQEALESYTKQYEVKLQYKRIGGYLMNNTFAEPKVKLVYELSPVKVKNAFEVLDAVTGKWTPVYENPGEKAAVVEPSDIKGHPAEKQLSELVKYGLIVPDENGKVNPDQEITVGEWVTYIAAASTPYYKGYNSGVERKAVAGVSPDSPYYDAVSFAAERGWMGRDAVVQPESKLTREGLAVQLTAFVQYSKISAFLDKDVAVSQFSDASSISNKGAVAVAVKLGLLQDENGKFNPQQTVTKGLAASVIMKLVELQGKTDQAIGGGNRF